MSHGMAPQQNAEGGEHYATLVASLSDALALIDASELPPEIGARLQEVIEAIEQRASLISEE